MEIWRRICVLFELLTIQLATLASATAFVNRRGRSDVGAYVRGIATAIGIITIFPLILIPFAMWRDWPTVISVVGIVWGIFTLWFSFTVMAPLGLLLTALSGEETRIRNPKTDTEEGFGERYVRFILTVLFVELAFVWYFSIFKVSNYRGMVPTLVIALILILLGGATWFKRVAMTGAVITVIVMTLAFAFPENFEFWKTKNEIRAQEVSFETFCLRNPLVPQCQNQATQEVRNQHATSSEPKGDWEEYKISPGKEVAVGWIEAGKQYWIQTDHPVRVGKHRLSGTTQWYGGTISGVLIVEAEKETRIRIKPL